jgi:hypothetical protein
LVRAISVIRLFAHLLILPVFRSFSIMLLTITEFHKFSPWPTPPGRANFSWNL